LQQDSRFMTKQYLTYKQVCARIALSRVQVTRLVRWGKFPRPVPVGPHHVRFIEDEVAEWQASREAMRAAGA